MSPRRLPARVRLACLMAKNGDEPCEDRCYLHCIYGGTPEPCGGRAPKRERRTPRPTDHEVRRALCLFYGLNPFLPSEWTADVFEDMRRVLDADRAARCSTDAPLDDANRNGTATNAGDALPDDPSTQEKP